MLLIAIISIFFDVYVLFAQPYPEGNALMGIIAIGFGLGFFFFGYWNKKRPKE